MLHFAVTDTGIGLSEEQASNLFRPFTQAQSDISRRYGGTGLGLAISKRLVEMMGGSIGVTSSLGNGSTFFFTLPLVAVDVGDEEDPRAAARRNALQGRSILIADDNTMARTALAEMAQGFGLQTTVVADGREAIKTLRAQAAVGQPFDMVVLDWRMPVMDGVEAARLIKSDSHLERMPAVLMVTAYSQDAMLEACEGMEVQGVLLKPVTQSAMFNTLSKACAALSEDLLLETPTTFLPDTSAYEALRGMRVLVADDNALNREVATDFLACVGIHAITVEDGRGVLHALQAQDVDAVLMDIHMPHMDGLVATREIRKHARWQNLPIIALTAQARTEDVQLSLDAGMNGHLCKPIDEVALYSTLLKYCPKNRGVTDEVHSAVLSPAQTTPAPQSAPSFSRLRGSPERRAQLLQGFLNDFKDLPVAWLDWVAQAQWQALAEGVHRIKGSASYLDASQLCVVADQIETAARRGEVSTIHALQDDFLRLVRACLEDVRNVLQELQTRISASSLPSMAVHDVLALVEQIRPMVVTGNFAAHGLLEKLVQGSASSIWAAAATAALQAFDDLERDEALARLDEICAYCRSEENL